MEIPCKATSSFQSPATKSLFNVCFKYSFAGPVLLCDAQSNADNFVKTLYGKKKPFLCINISYIVCNFNLLKNVSIIISMLIFFFLFFTLID